VALVKPKVAIFVKYEVWPNYLKVLEENNIPVVLISAIFKKRQVYFKGYGGFMRQALRKVSYIFVQNKESEELLRSIGISDITISGDTRFDRVAEILQRNNELAFMEEFKNGKLCFVAGSTWKEDEQFLTAYINECTLPVQFVIAPHTMDADHMTTLQKRLSKKTVRYSEIDRAALRDFQVLIVDTIGLLTKIYSYADVAYVGGGFATGLHNTLEPAVFAIPVIIGPNYSGFREAEDLVQLGGIVSVKKIP
jgi:3-deoxy-D-manno-octulosonic-acid transferase